MSVLTDVGLGHLERQVAELPATDRRSWNQALSDAFITLRKRHTQALQDLWVQLCTVCRFPFIQVWPKCGYASMGMSFRGTGQQLTAKGQQVLRDLLPVYSTPGAFISVEPDSVISSSVALCKYWGVGRLLVHCAQKHTEPNDSQKGQAA